MEADDIQFYNGKCLFCGEDAKGHWSNHGMRFDGYTCDCELSTQYSKSKSELYKYKSMLNKKHNDIKIQKEIEKIRSRMEYLKQYHPEFFEESD